MKRGKYETALGLGDPVGRRNGLEARRKHMARRDCLKKGMDWDTTTTTTNTITTTTITATTTTIITTTVTATTTITATTIISTTADNNTPKVLWGKRK